jgi:K+-transporting ATPase KdpF subunit
VRVVSVANIVGLALAVLIALLLVAALIHPERF